MKNRPVARLHVSFQRVQEVRFEWAITRMEVAFLVVGICKIYCWWLLTVGDLGVTRSNWRRAPTNRSR